MMRRFTAVALLMVSLLTCAWGDAQTLEGTWDLKNGNSTGTLWLYQNGSTITGLAKYAGFPRATVNGTVKGHTVQLVIELSHPINLSGTLGPDGAHLSGGTAGSPWTAVRTAGAQTQTLGGAPTKLINVAFGAGACSKTGYAATGQSSQDYWNFYNRDNGHGGYKLSDTISLRFADRKESGAMLNINNAPGAWGNKTSDPMYQTYVYPLNGGNVTINVSGLPEGKYDVYLYGHQPGDNGNSRYALAVGSTSYGAKATDGPGWNSVSWTEGKQYVLFNNVTVGKNDAMSIQVMPALNQYAVISGIQFAIHSSTK